MAEEMNPAVQLARGDLRGNLKGSSHRRPSLFKPRVSALVPPPCLQPAARTACDSDKPE